MGWYLYLLAGVMLTVAGLMITGSRRRNAMRARDISGNVIVGDVSGSASQASAPPQSTAPKSGPDRTAWAIGIIGVLVAIAQLAHDLWTE